MTDLEMTGDLAAMAEDELARACELSWRALRDVTPWGDSYDGFSPGGLRQCDGESAVTCGATRLAATSSARWWSTAVPPATTRARPGVG